MKLFNLIAKNDPRNMNTKYLTKKFIPYKHEFCQDKKIPFEDNTMSEFNKNLSLHKMENVANI